jgi:hypothetical protein
MGTKMEGDYIRKATGLPIEESDCVYDNPAKGWAPRKKDSWCGKFGKRRMTRRAIEYSTGASQDS